MRIKYLMNNKEINKEIFDKFVEKSKFVKKETSSTAIDDMTPCPGGYYNAWVKYSQVEYVTPSGDKLEKITQELFEEVVDY